MKFSEGAPRLEGGAEGSVESRKNFIAGELLMPADSTWQELLDRFELYRRDRISEVRDMLQNISSEDEQLLRDYAAQEATAEERAA